MRTIRLVVAVFFAASLAALPVSASLAKAHAATADMTMSASGDSCPCCDAIYKCVSGICSLLCHGTAAIAVEEQQVAQPPRKAFAGIGSAFMSPFARRPDPPPPRS